MKVFPNWLSAWLAIQMLMGNKSLVGSNSMLTVNLLDAGCLLIVAHWPSISANNQWMPISNQPQCNQPNQQLNDFQIFQSQTIGTIYAGIIACCLLLMFSRRMTYWGQRKNQLPNQIKVGIIGWIANCIAFQKDDSHFFDNQPTFYDNSALVWMHFIAGVNWLIGLGWMSTVDVNVDICNHNKNPQLNNWLDGNINEIPLLTPTQSGDAASFNGIADTDTETLTIYQLASILSMNWEEGTNDDTNTIKSFQATDSTVQFQKTDKHQTIINHQPFLEWIWKKYAGNNWNLGMLPTECWENKKIPGKRTGNSQYLSSSFKSKIIAGIQSIAANQQWDYATLNDIDSWWPESTIIQLCPCSIYKLKQGKAAWTHLIELAWVHGMVQQPVTHPITNALTSINPLIAENQSSSTMIHQLAAYPDYSLYLKQEGILAKITKGRVQLCCQQHIHSSLLLNSAFPMPTCIYNMANQQEMGNYPISFQMHDWLLTQCILASDLPSSGISIWSFTGVHCIRSWLLVITLYIRRYLLVPVIFFWNRIQQHQQLSWTDSWKLANKKPTEAYLICNHTGYANPLLEGDWPEDWYINGIQIRILNPLIMRIQYTNIQQQLSFTLNQLVLASGQPFKGINWQELQAASIPNSLTSGYLVINGHLMSLAAINRKARCLCCAQFHIKGYQLSNMSINTQSTGTNSWRPATASQMNGLLCQQQSTNSIVVFLLMIDFPKNGCSLANSSLLLKIIDKSYQLATKGHRKWWEWVDKLLKASHTKTSLAGILGWQDYVLKVQLMSWLLPLLLKSMQNAKEVVSLLLKLPSNYFYCRLYAISMPTIDSSMQNDWNVRLESVPLGVQSTSQNQSIFFQWLYDTYNPSLLGTGIDVANWLVLWYWQPLKSSNHYIGTVKRVERHGKQPELLFKEECYRLATASSFKMIPFSQYNHSLVYTFVGDDKGMDNQKPRTAHSLKHFHINNTCCMLVDCQLTVKVTGRHKPALTVPIAARKAIKTLEPYWWLQTEMTPINIPQPNPNHYSSNANRSAIGHMLDQPHRYGPCFEATILAFQKMQCWQGKANQLCILIYLYSLLDAKLEEEPNNDIHPYPNPVTIDWLMLQLNGNWLSTHCIFSADWNIGILNEIEPGECNQLIGLQAMNSCGAFNWHYCWWVMLVGNHARLTFSACSSFYRFLQLNGSCLENDMLTQFDAFFWQTDGSFKYSLILLLVTIPNFMVDCWGFQRLTGNRHLSKYQQFFKYKNKAAFIFDTFHCSQQLAFNGNNNMSKSIGIIHLTQ